MMSGSTVFSTLDIHEAHHHRGAECRWQTLMSGSTLFSMLDTHEAYHYRDPEWRWQTMMSGSTMFRTLNTHEAYHKLNLDLENCHLTTFYCTQGKLRNIKLNCGTISAQDISDKAVDDTIGYKVWKEDTHPRQRRLCQYVIRSPSRNCLQIHGLRWKALLGEEITRNSFHSKWITEEGEVNEEWSKESFEEEEENHIVRGQGSRLYALLRREHTHRWLYQL